MSDIVKRLRLLQIHLQDNDGGEAADTIEALRAENARLRALLNDCASELADEINARYGDAKHIHKHRYDRDMQTVRAARAAMGESDE